MAPLVVLVSFSLSLQGAEPLEAPKKSHRSVPSSVLFFTISWPQRHLGLCLMCLEVENDNKKSSRLKSLSRAILVLGRIAVFCFAGFQNPLKSFELSSSKKKGFLAF